MTTIRARVPSRIDFLGAGTDAPPFSAEHGGAVLNASISRAVTCTLEVGPHLSGVEINSLDFGVSLRAESVDTLEFNGQLDLLKAAVKRSGLCAPFRMWTEMDLPPQSGLGASGAMNVGVIAACRYALGQPIDPGFIVEEANAAERLDLGYPGGKQDPCGAAYGGINCFEFRDPQVIMHPINLAPELIAELEYRLLLVYTGVSHVSGNIHGDIKAAYADDASPCKRAMFSLKQVGLEGLDVLRRGDLITFGKMLSENWRYHQDLHPSCNNDHLRQVYQTAEEIGIIGGKTCGAGGGGCVVFFCAEGKKVELAKALEPLGCQVLHFNFDFQGIRVWALE